MYRKSAYLLTCLFFRILSFGKPSKHVSWSADTWDRQYNSSVWDYVETALLENNRNAVLGQIIRQYFGHNLYSPQILDVGCGTGHFLNFLCCNFNYTGVDVSGVAIRKAKIKHSETRLRKRSRVSDVAFVHSDALSFPALAAYHGTSYDVILFNEVLYYMDEDEMFDLYGRLLNEKGILILSIYEEKKKADDMNKNSPFYRISKKAHQKFNFIEYFTVSGIKDENDGKKTYQAYITFHIEFYRLKK